MQKFHLFATNGYKVLKKYHKIATNEGSAIACNWKLPSDKKCTSNLYANSGLGNIVNPITSLADPQVYGIPMVLMIGWRGEIDIDGNQVKDEPQHKKQGQITISQFKILDIPYLIIDNSTRNINQVLKDIVCSAKERNGPVALLVRKNSFEKYNYKKIIQKLNYLLGKRLLMKYFYMHQKKVQ